MANSELALGSGRSTVSIESTTPSLASTVTQRGGDSSPATHVGSGPVRDEIDLVGVRPAATLANVADYGKGIVDLAKATSAEPGGPPGLKAFRTQWLADLTTRSRVLDGTARALGALDALTSNDPGAETTRLAIRTVVADVVGHSVESAIEAARASGASRAAGALSVGGFVAGQVTASGVENIVQGFVDTDVSRYETANSLPEMLRSNSRAGRETYVALRKEGYTVAGALTTGMWRTLGSDLRAFSFYVARDVLELQ